MRKCRGFLRASRFRPQRAFRHTPGASRSFHVITGHTAQTGDTLPESLEALAALHGTLVFLMGLNSLEQIAARLTAAGKPPETPAAVVSGGNAPHPATVRGTLADIAEKARAAGCRRPPSSWWAPPRRWSFAPRPRPCCRWQACAWGWWERPPSQNGSPGVWKHWARPRFPA